MFEYQSNMDKVLSEVKDKLKKVQNGKQLLGIIAEQLRGDILIRVHENGLDMNLSPIGNYSKKPMYVSIDFLAGEVRQTGAGGKTLSPMGKTGKTGSIGGRKRKSRYFRGGYKEFKAEIDEVGKVGEVNFTLTGQLAGDLQIKYNSSIDGYDIGYSAYGSELYKQLEKHFNKQGKIFIASDKEIDKAVEGAEEEINKILT